MAPIHFAHTYDICHQHATCLGNPSLSLTSKYYFTMHVCWHLCASYWSSTVILLECQSSNPLSLLSPATVTIYRGLYTVIIVYTTATASAATSQTALLYWVGGLVKDSSFSKNIYYKIFYMATLSRTYFCPIKDGVQGGIHCIHCIHIMGLFLLHQPQILLLLQHQLLLQCLLLAGLVVQFPHSPLL